METNEFRVEMFTRREFRQARDVGKFGTAIVATGSIEQHLEHLAMVQDIASSTRIAELVAARLYPEVVLAVPINVGIAEHHMHSVGTLTVKPQTWLAVVYDTVETMVRHGIKQVLILNGHGGNRRPIYGVINQWEKYFAREHGDDVDLRFHNYWDVLSHEIVDNIQSTPGFPSHAKEFETSMALHLFPDNVRCDDIPYSEDIGASSATAEKGQKLTEVIVDGVADIVRGMIAGEPDETPKAHLNIPKRQT